MKGGPLSLWWHFQLFSVGMFKWPHLTQGLLLRFLLPLEKTSLVPSSALGWVDVELLFINSLYVPGSILDASTCGLQPNHSPDYASDGSENLISLPSPCSRDFLLIPAAFNLPVNDPWD